MSSSLGFKVLNIGHFVFNFLFIIVCAEGVPWSGLFVKGGGEKEAWFVCF